MLLFLIVGSALAQWPAKYHDQSNSLRIDFDAFPNGSFQSEWSTQLPYSTAVSQALVSNSVILALADTGVLYAFAYDGKMLWQDLSTSASIVASNKAVFRCGNQNDDLRAIALSSGDVLWRLELRCTSVRPVLVGNKLLVFQPNGFLAAYDAATGTSVWAFDPEPSRILDAMVATPDGQLAIFYAEGIGRSLRTVNVADGTANSTIVQLNERPSAPLLATNTRVFVSTSVWLKAFDLHSRKELWTIVLSPIQLALSGGALYVQTASTFGVLDAETGRPLWSKIGSDPLIAVDANYVYCSNTALNSGVTILSYNLMDGSPAKNTVLGQQYGLSQAGVIFLPGKTQIMTFQQTNRETYAVMYKRESAP